MGLHIAYVSALPQYQVIVFVTFIGVLECKFNLDGLLQVIYEHGP
jgi:hypothetical protein